MAEHASDYHRGEMDIHEQAATYAAVMSGTKWGALYLSSALLFLVLWFCTATGFLGALISGVVVAILGTVLLRKPASGH